MMKVKEAVSMVPFLVELFRIHFVDEKAKELAVALTQETCHPSRKRRKPMENLSKFAKQWKDVLVKLSISHTKEGIDQADYRTEDLFTGLYAMPVKQVREFYDLRERALLHLEDGRTLEGASGRHEPGCGGQDAPG